MLRAKDRFESTSACGIDENLNSFLIIFRTWFNAKSNTVEGTAFTTMLKCRQ